MNFPKPHFGAEFNPDFVHLTPALFYMRGEYAATGENAGLMIGLSWFGCTLSVDFC